MTVAVEDAAVVAAVRGGDEDAFARMLDAHGSGMRRFALAFVRDPALADDVVQEAWLAVLRGLDGFDGRASLRSWIFRVVTTTVTAHARRTPGSVRFPAFADEAGGEEPSVDPSRFRNPRFPGGWTAFPAPWGQLHAREARAVVADAIDQLPPGQRLVITLRDVEGWSAEEVCAVLELSTSDQQVLLHRARSKVRSALERHLERA